MTPEGKSYICKILSLDSKDSWLLHAGGKIAVETQTINAILQRKYERTISVTDYYQQVKKQGLEYGTSFQALTELWVGVEEAKGKIELSLAAENYQFHRVLLDASLQVLGVILLDNDTTDTYLPVRCDRFQVYRRPDNCLWSHVQLKSVGQQIKADLQLFDQNKALVAQIEGLTLRYANRSKSVKADLSNWLYEVTWQPKPKNLQPRKTENWLIFAGSKGIGASLADKLKETGDSASAQGLGFRIVLVFPSQTYQKVKENYYINLANPQDFQQLIAEIKQSLDKVVHLWSTDETDNIFSARTPESPLNPPSLGDLNSGSPQNWGVRGTKSLNTQQMGCGSVLHLIQALTQAAKSPQLLLVTQAVDNQTPLQIQHSTL